MNFSGSNAAGCRPPGVEGRQRMLALEAVALLFIADFLAQFFFERFQQVEGHIGGLKVLGAGMGDVMHQGAEGARTRGRRWRVTTGQ